MMNKRLMYLLPLAVFLVLAVYFLFGLRHDPRAIPSVLINQPAPEFSLAAIEGRDKGFSTADLKGRVSLVNFFGSWCPACRAEHAFLMKIKEVYGVPLHGVDWREENRVDGPAWLARLGDPYTLIGDDPDSKAAIGFWVYGAPETFVVDKTATIRYKHTGPMTQEVWDRTIAPMIEELNRQ